MSELLWVPVPGGLSGSQAVIQVLVVPRLQAGQLADFGIQDWPATLAASTFDIRTRTSDGIQAVQAEVTYQDVAVPDVWQAFFGGQAGLVNEWTRKTHPAPMVADTYRQAGDVVGTYQTSATAMAMPDENTPAVVRRQLDHWFDETPMPSAPPQPPIPPHAVADFHGTVAMLREHPAVLRKLGLIFEVTVDRSALDVGDPDERYLSIRCPDPPLSFLVTAPWTHYLLTDSLFVPAPSTDSAVDIHAGLLDLGQAPVIVAPPPQPEQPPPPTRWAVTTFEVDGVVGRLRGAAQSARRSENDVGLPDLPHIRSAGFMLVRPGRADDFANRVAVAAANAGLDSTDEAVFHAEDLILGYRVDVRMGDDSHWYPLCARQARYEVNGLAIEQAGRLDEDGYGDEEGHIKANAAVKDADNSLHADQIVTRWDGWSLAVPRPNLLDNTAGAARRPDVALPYEFTWDYRLKPGTLPSLRFSQKYSLRVRIADLAGGGLGADHESSSSTATETIFYWRHEPVLPPVPHASSPLAVGAAIDRLVIRSDHNLSVAEVSQADPGYPLTDQRVLLPPQTTFGVAEQHGEFDPPRTEEQTRRWAERALTAYAEQGETAGHGLPDPAVGGVNARLRGEPGGVEEFVSELSKWQPDWPDYDDKSIELVDRSAGEGPMTLHWRGDRLVVGLAKAEQTTIALSSTIRRGYAGHLAMYEWLARAHVPEASLAEALNGEHPMLSPPRVVHLVHAVRRPLVEPRWRLPSDSIVRTEGDTTAVLHPTFRENGLNTDSTVQVDVAAHWTERSDIGEEEVVVERLHTEPVARGKPQFNPMRHSFGDTKHRTVTYTLTAISRFRDYYHPTEPDTAFQVATTQQPVSIVSSARPSPPIVRSVTPAFRWESGPAGPDRLERVRRGQRLRVQLARPWYETGEGERLAVVVADEDPSPEQAEFLTRAGRDPISASPALPTFPPADWFSGTTGEVKRLFLPEFKAHVQAVPYAVTDAADHWSADVEISTPSPDRSYNPFIRLILARYQPESLRGLELSTVVAADLVQLPPDRRLTVSRTGESVKSVRVELAGTGPAARNAFEVTVEHCIAPERLPVDEVDLIDIGDQFDPRIPAWRPVDGLTVLSHDGVADLPSLPTALGPLRLRVREIELPSSRVDPATATELMQRSHFIDVVRLPAEWILDM
ncbi:hypothetical protein [Streptomyces sp. NPDC001970]